MNIDNLCMNCMNELNGESFCPNCGSEADFSQETPFLPFKVVVGNKYIIGRAISSNSEGITYMAFDVDNQMPVIIREFYPIQFAQRNLDGVGVFAREENLYFDYLGQFLDLWGKIASVRGFSAIIPVIDIIEENNTAYVISEYIESLSLRDFLLRSQTGYLNWEKANQIFMPVLSLLSTLHEMGIYHYGISPDTLLIGRDGKLRLAGFSVTDCRLAGTNLTPEFFEGYTPIEQYNHNFKTGSWSDVYSFCAVVYRALVGSAPQDALSRSQNDKLIIPARYAEIIPGYVINALMNGLQVDPQDRSESIETLYEELSATPSNVISSFSGVSLQPKEPKKQAVVYVEEDSPQSTIFKTFIIILIVGLIAFGGWIAYEVISNRSEKTPTEEVTDNVKMVEVPNFVNCAYNEIIQNPVQNQRFIIKSVNEYSADIEKGHIVSQSIAPGSKVKEGTEITFVVSKGPEYVTVPAVVGNMQELAVTQLENAGFTVEVVMRENLGGNEEGTVAEVSPGEGTTHIKGTKITVYVWDEPSLIPDDLFSDNGLLGDLIEGLFP